MISTTHLFDVVSVLFLLLVLRRISAWFVDAGVVTLYCRPTVVFFAEMAAQPLSHFDTQFKTPLRASDSNVGNLTSGMGSESSPSNVSNILVRAPSGKTWLNLNSLPPEAADYLKPFDLNHDGKIDKEELLSMALKQDQLRLHNDLMKRFIVIALVIIIIMLMGGFGLSFAVYELAKDVEVATGGVLTEVGTHVPIQTANTEIQTDEAGVIRDRRTGRAVKTADSIVQLSIQNVTSAETDEYWTNFREFYVKDDDSGSSVLFRVQSFGRKVTSADDGVAESTIVLYHTLGKIFLTGSEWSFDEATSEVLADFGFPTETHAPGKRRLLFLGRVGKGRIYFVGGILLLAAGGIFMLG